MLQETRSEEVAEKLMPMSAVDQYSVMKYLERLGQAEIALFHAHELAEKASVELRKPVSVWQMKRLLKALKYKTKLAVARAQPKQSSVRSCKTDQEHQRLVALESAVQQMSQLLTRQTTMIEKLLASLT